MNASSLAMTLAEARVSLAWTRRVSLFAVGTVANKGLRRRSDMAGLRDSDVESPSVWPSESGGFGVSFFIVKLLWNEPLPIATTQTGRRLYTGW